MTNEECRTALKRIAGYMCARKDIEALTHAMNELEHISSGLVKNSKELEKDFGELDCISRKRAIERLKLNLPISDGADNSRDRHRYMQCLADIQAIRELKPSVTPQEPQSFKWCTDCKEYDTEKHCCHRYSKVIRNTVAEIRQEPKTGYWIGIDEEPHEDYECDKCGYIISTYTANIEPHTEYKYCPNCGVKMVEPQESEDKE